MHATDFSQNESQLSYITPSSKYLQSSSNGRSMKDLEEQLTQLKKENFNLKLRIYFAEERKKILQGVEHTDELVEKIMKLQVDHQNLKTELCDKEDLIVQTAKAMESLEKGHENQKSEMKRLHDAHIKQLQNKIDQLEMDMTYKKFKHETAGTSLQNESVIRELENQVVNLESKLVDSKHTIANLEEELTQSKQEIKSMSDQMSELENEMTTRNSRLGEVYSEAKQAEQQRRIYQDEVRNMKNQITKLERNLQSKYDDLERERSKQSSFHNDEQFSQQNNLLDQLHQHKQDLEIKLNELQITLENEQKQIEILNEKLQHEKSNGEKLAKQNEMLKLENEKLKQNLNRSRSLCQRKSPHSSRSPSPQHYPSGAQTNNLNEINSAASSKGASQLFINISQSSNLEDKYIELNDQYQQLAHKHTNLYEVFNETCKKLEKSDHEYKKALIIIRNMVKENKKNTHLIKNYQDRIKYIEDNVRSQSRQQENRQHLASGDNTVTTTRGQPEGSNEVIHEEFTEKDIDLLEKQVLIEDYIKQINELNIKLEKYEMELEQQTTQNQITAQSNQLQQSNSIVSQSNSASTSNEDMTYMALQLKYKTEEIERLNIELKKRTLNLQELVNIELWNKNKEIEKLNKKLDKKCSEYNYCKLLIQNKNNQLLYIKKDINKLWSEVENNYGQTINEICNLYDENNIENGEHCENYNIKNICKVSYIDIQEDICEDSNSNNEINKENIQLHQYKKQLSNVCAPTNQLDICEASDNNQLDICEVNNSNKLNLSADHIKLLSKLKLIKNNFNLIYKDKYNLINKYNNNKLLLKLYEKQKLEALNACAILNKRLKEMIDFLESLISVNTSDEQCSYCKNGNIDNVQLSHKKKQYIKYTINNSKELYKTFNNSLNLSNYDLNNSKALISNSSTSHTVVPLPVLPDYSEINFLSESDDLGDIDDDGIVDNTIINDSVVTQNENNTICSNNSKVNNNSNNLINLEETSVVSQQHNIENSNNSNLIPTNKICLYCIEHINNINKLKAKINILTNQIKHIELFNKNNEIHKSNDKISKNMDTMNQQNDGINKSTEELSNCETFSEPDLVVSKERMGDVQCDNNIVSWPSSDEKEEDETHKYKGKRYIRFDKSIELKTLQERLEQLCKINEQLEKEKEMLERKMNSVIEKVDQGTSIEENTINTSSSSLNIKNNENQSHQPNEEQINQDKDLTNKLILNKLENLESIYSLITSKQHQDKQTNHQQDLNQLQTEIIEIKNNNHKLNKQINEYKINNEILNKNLQENNENYNSLLSKYNGIKQEINTKENYIEKLKQQEAQYEIDKLDHINNKEIINQLNLDINNYKTELNNKTQELNNINKEINDIKIINKQLNENLNRNNKLIYFIKSKYKQIKLEYNNYYNINQYKIHEHRNENELKDKDIKELNKQIEMYKTDMNHMKDIQEECKEYKNEIMNMKLQIENTNNKIEDYKCVISELKNNLNDQVNSNKTLKDETNQLINKINLMENNKKIWEKDINNLRVQLKTYRENEEKELVQHTKLINEMTARIENFKIEKLQYHYEIKQLKNQIIECTKEKDELILKYSQEHESLLNKCNVEIGNKEQVLRDIQNDMKSKLEDKNSKIEQIEEFYKVQILEQMKCELEKRVNELEISNIELEKKLTNYNQMKSYSDELTSGGEDNYLSSPRREDREYPRSPRREENYPLSPRRSLCTPPQSPGRNNSLRFSISRQNSHDVDSGCEPASSGQIPSSLSSTKYLSMVNQFSRDNASPDLGIDSDHGRISTSDASDNPDKSNLNLSKLKEENDQLQRMLHKTRQALESTIKQLAAANRRKCQIERDICKQLHKTQHIIRKARVNIQSTEQGGNGDHANENDENIDPLAT